MNLLFDACVARHIAEALAAAGYDVDWGGNWHGSPADAEVLEAAAAAERVLIALDRDFGELAVVFGHRHAGIVRLVQIPLRAQGDVIRAQCIAATGGRQTYDSSRLASERRFEDSALGKAGAVAHNQSTQKRACAG